MSPSISDHRVCFGVNLEPTTKPFEDDLVIFKKAGLSENRHYFCFDKHGVYVNPVGKALNLQIYLVNKAASFLKIEGVEFMWFTGRNVNT